MPRTKSSNITAKILVDRTCFLSVAVEGLQVAPLIAGDSLFESPM